MPLLQDAPVVHLQVNQLVAKLQAKLNSAKDTGLLDQFSTKLVGRPKGDPRGVISSVHLSLLADYEDEHLHTTSCVQTPPAITGTPVNVHQYQ